MIYKEAAKYKVVFKDITHNFLKSFVFQCVGNSILWALEGVNQPSTHVPEEKPCWIIYQYLQVDLRI